MTETVRKENEILENQAAEKAPNPVYKALCRFASWFGFGSKLYGSNKHRKKIFFDVITYIILIGGSLTMLYPFWWMLVASLNNNTTDTLQTVFWPNSIAEDGFFYNYSRVIQKFSTAFVGANYWRIVANTILYSVVPVVVGVIVSAAAAFAFAKIDFKGKNIVFFYCMFAIMIPFPALIVVQYCLYSELNWTTNGLAMIIPGCFGSVMTAFFSRRQRSTVPAIGGSSGCSSSRSACPPSWRRASCPSWVRGTTTLPLKCSSARSPGIICPLLSACWKARSVPTPITTSRRS